MKKKIFFTLFILLFCSKVSALTYAGCDINDVVRMKQIVTNVNVSYNYHIAGDNAYFDVIISNLTNDIYVTDNYFNGTYSNFINGELVIYNVETDSLSLKFNSNKEECSGLLLGIKYQQFPIFNKYYYDDICENMEGFSYCNKWLKKKYTYDEIKAAIKKYNDSLINEKEEPTKVIYNKSIFDILIDFYVDYYYFVLPGIILICVIAIVISKRKNQFGI